LCLVGSAPGLGSPVQDPVQVAGLPYTYPDAGYAYPAVQTAVGEYYPSGYAQQPANEAWPSTWQVQLPNSHTKVHIYALRAVF
jgi:hypothetical protein